MVMSKEQNSDILRLAKGTGISLVGGVTGKLFLLLSHVIIARFLGVKPFGIFVLATVVFRIAELVARFGLNIAAMRFTSIYRNDSAEKLKGVLISSASIAFFNGIVVGSLLYVASGSMSETVFHQPQLKDIIRILCFCIPFTASMTVIAASTQGFHTTKYSVYIQDLIRPLTNLILVIACILLNAGIKGVVYAFLLSHITAFISGIYFLIRKRFLNLQKSLRPKYNIRELVLYSAPLLVNSVLIFLMAWIDTIMLGVMRGPSEVGVYRAAVQIPLLMAIVLHASNSIYAPVSAELFSRGQMARLSQTLKTTTRWVFSLTLPIALVLFFSSTQLMSIFGAEFVHPGATILMIFTVTKIFNCVTGGVGNTLVMTGKQNIYVLNSIGMITLNVVFNLLLISRFGSVGAALATGISLAAINVLMLIEVYIIHRIHPYNIDYLKIIGNGIVSAAIIVLFKNIFTVDSKIFAVAVNCCIVGAVFTVSWVFADSLDEDKYLFEAVKAKLGILKKNV